MGRLAAWLAIESVTAIWQLSVLPRRPQYCRATPTECTPFLAKPVSSTISRRMRSIRPPSLDFALRLDIGLDDITHLGQHRLVGPSPFTDKMQQGLVFRRGPFR